MEFWAIQQDKVMDGVDVSQLVANAFLQYANVDFNIVDYYHLAIFFYCSIKQGYYIEDLPINETFEHIIITIERHYARGSTDNKSMGIKQMYTY
jgi:hypothetical protein